MSVNKVEVLEHIAAVTNNDVSEIERHVKVEYWKDLISFNLPFGIDLFAEYLRKQDITEVKGSRDLVAINVHKGKFGKAASSHDVAVFCIEGMYASRFMEAYKNEFTFTQ